MKFNPKPFERSLTRYIARQAGFVQEIIDKAIAQVVLETERFGVTKEEDSDFFFSDYPGLSRKVDGVIRSMSARITDTVRSGIEWGWDLSNTKSDAMVWGIINSIGSTRVPYYAPARWMQKNLPALEAFETRRTGGMGLSDRVWNFASGVKGDLELALDIGLGEGLSADRLSREVRRYLREPDRLYRRVRDEKGVLRLSKSASNYHPGQGVYRSSYKNARRLTATETNMAYRSADYERIQQLDFILGIEIHLSNNHTCLGPDGKPHPFFDICDELEGKYPSWFKFTGWHPLCRCYTTTILPTQEEMIEYLASMDENGHSDYQFSGRVEDVPPQFKEWVANNADRIEAAEGRGKLPYFLRDNRESWEGRLEEIKNAKETADNGIDSDIAKALGVKKGRPMSFEDADTGRENPHYDVNKIDEWRNNCQTCTMVHELRRRGFDIEVAPNARKLFDTMDWEERFLNEDGSKTKREWSNMWAWQKGYKKMSDLRAAEFFAEKMSAPGRYEIYVKWSGANAAHVFLAEVGADGTPHFFDPQSGRDNYTFLSLIEKKKIGVMRIDDKKINPKCASVFLPKGGK